MKKRYNGTYSYLKDAGCVRTTNEDECVISVNANGDILLLVADGLGGHQKGDYASHETVSYIKDNFLLKDKFNSFLDAYFWSRKVVKKANKIISIAGRTKDEYKGMGTTLVFALVHKEKMIMINVGDSRCYLHINNKLEQLSEDQTYVNYLFNAGLIKEEEKASHVKRHVLTNSIGMNPSLSFEIIVKKYNGEKIMLCSDGLYNNLSNKDIETILNTDVLTEQKVATLVNSAKFNGGSDNISVALWEPLND